MPILALLLAAATSTAAIDTAITEQIKEQQVTGAAVGVYQNGTLVSIKTYGLRDVAKKLPVDADTRFEIGSVTKQFTAAAILQLQEQGKLSIDDPLAKYLPSFPHASEVTLHQLLNQISGLPNYTGMPDIGTLMSTIPDATDKIVAFEHKPLDFTPGTKWEYSNTNYWVLGKVVARVSGMRYEDYIREYVFKPAGMTHSGFVSDESSFDDFAIPYWQGPKNDGPTQPAPVMLESWPAGAGAIVSTVGDLALWDSALASGKIVSPESFALMSSPGHLVNGKATDYGMGLEIGPHEGHERVGHDGGTMGSLSVNATYPNDHVEIIVLENNVRGQPEAVETAVLETMYPDARIAARKPAPGEDLSVRPHIVHLLDGVLNGTLAQSQLSPQMQKILTPDVLKQSAAHFATFGAPTAIIFKVKDDSGFGATGYVYRIEFAHGEVRNFEVQLDNKTGIVTGMQLAPG
ncbi:MAG TPA: serine hydrolase domain-containing protein [Verrucomicrobiae bacterium]|nr:serine hydrolase domain-containing protein [Verrucomicrobiae bacterium]HTZ54668.1 serine hydrolase domain-containing protein [Candidatus Acidoferrum sp.]